MAQTGDEGRFVEILGAALLDMWSTLPRQLQHDIFERAILLGHRTMADESLREQLAVFLHDHNQRTAAF